MVAERVEGEEAEMLWTLGWKQDTAPPGARAP